MTKIKTKNKPIPFEKTLNELETIVQQLEKGDLSLEESLEHFEKGITLARQCQNTLSQAEQKVTLLSENQSIPPLHDDD